MPKDRCNQQLQQLIAEIQTRQVPQASGPRILVTGSIIDNPTLIQLIEEVGGIVVADDLCTTTKYFWQEVEQNKDPWDALSRYNTQRCLCSCMHPAEKRFDYLWELIEEFGVAGVIYLNLKYCHPSLYEAALFRGKLTAKDIPTLMLEVDHSLSGLGQLRTRIQAFIEML
jgi:benzoyl-CoA reductase subunit C